MGLSPLLSLFGCLAGCSSEPQRRTEDADTKSVVAPPPDAGPLPFDARPVDTSRVDAAAVTAPDANLQAAPDASEGDAAGPAHSCAMDTADAGIPGVHIHVEGERCSFAYQQPGSFRYRVELDRPIPYRVEAGTSCGFCRSYSSDAAPLTHAQVFGAVGSDTRSYCADCDLGCCAPDRDGNYELAVQSFEGTLSWPARVWSGPSDTTTGLGDWFPKGKYFVMVQLSVPGVGMAFANLPITID